MKTAKNPLTEPENTAQASVDYVNAPPHYQQGTIEAIDAIRSQLTPDEFRGYLKGTIAKYIWRERHKGGTQDLEKAAWYLERLVRADRGA